MALVRCPKCGRVADGDVCFACGHEWDSSSSTPPPEPAVRAPVTLAHEEIAFDVDFAADAAAAADRDVSTQVRPAPNLLADVPSSEVAESTVMRSYADLAALLDTPVAPSPSSMSAPAMPPPSTPPPSMPSMPSMPSSSMPPPSMPSSEVAEATVMRSFAELAALTASPSMSLPSMPTPMPPLSVPSLSMAAPSMPAPSMPAPSMPAPSMPAPSMPAPSMPAPSMPAPSMPAPSMPFVDTVIPEPPIPEAAPTTAANPEATVVRSYDEIAALVAASTLTPAMPMPAVLGVSLPSPEATASGAPPTSPANDPVPSTLIDDVVPASDHADATVVRSLADLAAAFEASDPKVPAVDAPTSSTTFPPAGGATALPPLPVVAVPPVSALADATVLRAAVALPPLPPLAPAGSDVPVNPDAIARVPIDQLVARSTAERAGSPSAPVLVRDPPLDRPWSPVGDDEPTLVRTAPPEAPAAPTMPPPSLTAPRAGTPSPFDGAFDPRPAAAPLAPVVDGGAGLPSARATTLDPFAPPSAGAAFQPSSDVPLFDPFATPAPPGPSAPAPGIPGRVPPASSSTAALEEMSFAGVFDEPPDPPPFAPVTPAFEVPLAPTPFIPSPPPDASPVGPGAAASADADHTAPVLLSAPVSSPPLSIDDGEVVDVDLGVDVGAPLAAPPLGAPRSPTDGVSIELDLDGFGGPTASSAPTAPPLSARIAALASSLQQEGRVADASLLQEASAALLAVQR